MSDLSPFDATAEELLLEHLLEGGSHGRVVVKEHGVEIAVYIDKGTILAANASDDGRMLLRRVKLEALLDDATARAVEIELARHDGIGPILDGVTTEALETPLRDRFVENVARAVISRTSAVYEAVASPFVENLQLVYNAQGLIADCKNLGELAQSLDEDLELAVGPRAAGDERQQRVIDIVTQGITRAGAVADRVPEEPLAARALVVDLLDLSVLVSAAAVAQQAAIEAIPLEPVATRAGSLPSMPFMDLGVVVPVDAPPARAEPAAAPSRGGKSFLPASDDAPKPSAAPARRAATDDDDGPSIPIVPVVLAFVMLGAVVLGVYLALG